MSNDNLAKNLLNEGEDDKPTYPLRYLLRKNRTAMVLFYEGPLNFNNLGVLENSKELIKQIKTGNMIIDLSRHTGVDEKGAISFLEVPEILKRNHIRYRICAPPPQLAHLLLEKKTVHPQEIVSGVSAAISSLSFRILKI